MLHRLIAASFLFSLSSCASAADREKYETPLYQPVVSEGAFEIREYPPVVVASTPMISKRGQNSAFMTLFGYISGKNAKAQKIEMTTPVFSTMEEEDNAMSFVVPAKVVEGGVPEANSSEVSIRTRSAGRFAVYRYSGRWTQERDREARDKLMAWIKERGLQAEGGFEKASYDPPFTPPSKRRNEVLVRLAK